MLGEATLVALSATLDLVGLEKKILYHYFFLIRLQECSAPVIVCAKELSKLANAIGKTHNQPNWHEQ